MTDWPDYVTVDGKRLFVDIRGNPAGPALLYLHGGPGMGCDEFMQWQGDRLADKLLVIGLDQRGVLRSDRVADGEPLNEDLLAEDCEAVRAALGIETWSVLGHSFGGRIALRYAIRHPAPVTAVIFDCPGWDRLSADRFRLPAVAKMYDERGEPEKARRCRELAAGLDDDTIAYQPAAMLDAISGVPWYLADPADAERLRAAEPDVPQDMIDRSDAHAARITGAPQWQASLLPLLSELTMPALLMHGRSDLVCSPDQIDAFRRQVRHGQVLTFEKSGHFPQFEEPAAYASAVTGFAAPAR